jgi:[ribosomal protein S5]-alanine N-acetyltransferase
MKTTIRTKRLTLRPFIEADARRIAYLAGEYDVAKMCGRVPHPYTMADAHDFIGLITHGWDSAREFSFAITAPIDGLIGSCGVMRTDGGEAGAFELGYWLGRPYWGMGYASEAAQGVMDWARDQAGALTFAAGHYLDNPASGHVLRKLGFAPTGQQDLYGRARQATSPAERYMWPESATPAILTHNHDAHPSH